jgi:hypothetical protein
MGKIYSSAARVLIWLGPEHKHSDLVMDVLGGGPNQLSPSDFLYSLELLLRRDWFSRVWVAQELGLASHDPFVVCGDRWVTWSLFADFVRSLNWRILSHPLSAVDRDAPRGVQYFDKHNGTRWYVPDLDCQKAVASVAVRVNNLADIRKAGKEASFP